MRFSMKLQIAVFAGLALGQPVNDDCANGTPITEGEFTGDTTGATVDSLLTRDFSPCAAYFNDIWYSYTAGCSGVAMAVATGECDLVLATWHGNCSAFDGHICEDNGPAAGSETLFFPVEMGQQYLVSVADYSADCMGPVTLQLSCSVAPSNDQCTSALGLSDGLQGGLSNIGASVGGEPSGASACPSSFHDVWFTYNASCTGKTTVTITNPTSDLELALWTGATCASLMASQCGDTGGPRQPDQLTFATQEDSVYFLSVAGYADADFANFDATVTCVPRPPAPANDVCMGALTVNDGSTTSSFSGATHSNGTNCGTSADVWLNYSASCDGIATVTVTPICSNDDLTLQMWSDCATAGACRDVGSPSESAVFTTAQGQGYLFLVGTKSSPMCQSDFMISASCVPRGSPPANDECEGAYAVGEGANNAANAGATDSPHPGCTIHSDVWYRYVANCTGSALASLGNLNDEVLTVWNGNNCSSLSLRQCVRNGTVQFSTVQGSSYFISVGAYGIYQGPLLLTLACSTAPTGAPTPPPTAHPTFAGCPDFQGFFLNCSASNFTDNARCSDACAQAAQHAFDGASTNSSVRVQCLSAVEFTWNSSAAIAVLTQRVAAGASLCRSGAAQVLCAWLVPFVLFLTLMS